MLGGRGTCTMCISASKSAGQHVLQVDMMASLTPAVGALSVSFQTLKVDWQQIILMVRPCCAASPPSPHSPSPAWHGTPPSRWWPAPAWMAACGCGTCAQRHVWPPGGATPRGCRTCASAATAAWCCQEVMMTQRACSSAEAPHGQRCLL